MMNFLRGLVLRIGRRGSFLLFLALLDCIYGYALIWHTTPSAAQIHLYPSALAWGIAWFVVGTVCFIEAFFTLDRLAFALAALIKFLWAAQMFVTWAVFHTNPLGWTTGTVFLAFCALTGIVSFWPEQRRFKIEDR